MSWNRGNCIIEIYIHRNFMLGYVSCIVLVTTSQPPLKCLQVTVFQYIILDFLPKKSFSKKKKIKKKTRKEGWRRARFSSKSLIFDFYSEEILNFKQLWNVLRWINDFFLYRGFNDEFRDSFQRNKAPCFTEIFSWSDILLFNNVFYSCTTTNIFIKHG